MRRPAVLLVLLVLVFPVRAQDKAGTQVEKKSEKTKLNYWLYLPPKYDTEKDPFPMIVFLHGAGETGTDLKKVKIHGPPKLADKKEFPFIIVSPQAPVRTWKPQEVADLVDEVAAKYKVDKDRIYLTGLSMGGFGTWATAAAFPDKFAAIAPICGGGDPNTAEKLKGIPIWVFHGAKDTAVRPERSEAMVKALKEAGHEVKYTLYPDAAHDSWTVTYNNQELYDWFLSHKRKKK